MAAAMREQDTSVADRLFREFYKFSFFQAVTLLEQSAPGAKPLGEALSPADEAVRFHVRPGFSFPPSDIGELRAGDDGLPADLDVTFLGLIGPSGMLPHWYNELAMERLQQKDPVMAAFFDIFHHRLLSLFYLAWKRYHVSTIYRLGADDRFSFYLKCLIGLGTGGLTGRIGLPEESLIFSCGLLSRQVPSAAAVQSAVAYYSGQKTELDQFIERVIAIPPEDCTRLGSANAELGVTALCGSQARENQTKFRISLGSMTLPDFFRFLPTGDMLKPIFSLVRYMVGIEYDFDFRIVLKKEEVPPLKIGGALGATSPRLGWSTWIKTPGVLHADDPYVTFDEAHFAGTS